MGFTEVLAGRIARAYRTVFGNRCEGQMVFYLYKMFLAHNFVKDRSLVSTANQQVSQQVQKAGAGPSYN